MSGPGGPPHQCFKVLGNAVKEGRDAVAHYERCGYVWQTCFSHLDYAMYRILSLLCLTVGVLCAEPLVRQANETLRLPSTLPGGTFETESAFDDLSFDRPVALVTPPGETDRLFVVEQRGRILVIPSLGNPSKETFLDISEATTFEGESGLLGLAFHPQYVSNGWFYVFYSRSEGGQRFQRVSRFNVDPQNANRALAESEQPLLEQEDEASNHNGGDLHFGPDGYLYIALGDEGGANDGYDNSRFIDKDFFCAIARIDVDHLPGSLQPNPHPGVYSGTYAIPPDNPFIGVTEFAGRVIEPSNVRTEFWAVGLRNPWRFHFDPATGRLFSADVGQNSREEVNLITRGGHYGWSFREGSRTFTRGPGRRNEPVAFAPARPIWDYARNEGVSVTGGVVYRGEAHTELYEAYIFGDYGSGSIWALHFNEDDSVRVKEIASDSQISAFGVDPRNGDVLLTSYGRGEVRRLVRKTKPFGLLTPSKLSRTGAFADLETLTPNAGIVSYEPNVSFWSDGARKRRWFSVPDVEDTILFDPAEPWTFPVGTVWIKHFEIGDADSLLRLETRFLVKTATGSYGLTYAWNEDQTDADLIDTEGVERTVTVTEGGVSRQQQWLFPSRNACRACHTSVAGQALGFSTAQLNRAHDYDGGTANQLEALNEAGYFRSAISKSPAQLPQLAPAGDDTRSLEHRARSYLAVNCAQCHQPNGPALGFWDARYTTRLSQSGMVNGSLQSNQSAPGMRVIAPGSPEESMVLARMQGSEGLLPMPPIGLNRVHAAGLSLIREWVLSLEDSPAHGYDDWVGEFLAEQPLLATDREADPDRDGRSNFEEYLGDSHPGDPQDRWLEQIQVYAEGTFLTLPAIPNGKLEMQFSDDFKVWTSLEISPESILPQPGEGFQIRVSGEISPVFYRFRLLESE